MKYEEADVQQMRRALEDGDVTAKDLLRQARDVIERTNGTLNACVALYESADRDADRADDLLKSGNGSPLTGIPIAVKDNICIEGQPVTAASKILEGFRSPYSATVIEKLQQQGAVLVCRANMDEFAMGSSTEHSVYGTTYNPHDTERVAGGSSGGSAALVASGAVPLALGSDTGGSIRQPASFCGVVGLKPTYGSLSRHGLIALGSSLDVIGPIARTAADAELLFAAARGEDTCYDSTVDSFARGSCKEGGVVIGVPDNLDEIGIAKETMAAFEETLDRMKQRGHTVAKVSLAGIEKAGSIYYIIQPAEASSNLARFDGIRYGLSVPGDDLWEGYRKTRSEGFGDEVSRRIVIGTYVLSAGYRDAYYNRAVAARNQLRNIFADALTSVDVIAMPTTPDVAFKEGAMQNPVTMYAEDRLTLQANLTGMPAISVPMHCSGLPRGIQYLANYGCESVLFACAKDTESQIS
ncbi:MAG: Asp-tRNA(Asn)/Glu-tRNA(Gln) amidotransferase subunit GatA [Candidatus Kaiserbacteria bacterium]|nr:Asp-tRNA(Asn)/Glu-tRNA(Gln) amidotransferase subunit GatA [Candidatus Kaiserbacteria bacterium]